MESLKDGQLVAPCFVDALQDNSAVGGRWNGRIEGPTPPDKEQFSRVRSTLSPSFQECVTRRVSEQIVDLGYHRIAPRTVLTFDFPNPFEYQGTEQGFPMLEHPQYRGLNRGDWELILDRVEESIVAPLRIAQQRLDATDHLTRLSAVVAAEHLTADVSFAQVPGYADLPAARRATRTIECDGVERTDREGNVYEMRSWTLDPPRGTPVNGRGDISWPVRPGQREAARLIVSHGPRGELLHVEGHSEDGEVRQVGRPPEQSSPPADTTGDELASESSESTAEQDQSSDPSGLPWGLIAATTALLAFLALGVATLRRS